MMKVFTLDDGSTIQIVSKDRIETWDAEAPILFVNYIREKRIEKYGSSKNKKLVEEYLDSVLEDVAIPKLIAALNSEEREERMSVAKRLADVSKDNTQMIKTVLKFLEDALKKEKDKEIESLIETSVKNYTKYVKRKKYAKKKRDLQNKLKDLDQKLVEGDIDSEEYVKLRKEMLLIDQEVEK
jgi:hypothetical protein